MNLAELKRNLEFVEHTHNLEEIEILRNDYRDENIQYSKVDIYLKQKDGTIVLVVK